MQGKIFQPVDAFFHSLCQIVEISLFPWTLSWKGYYWTLGTPPRRIIQTRARLWRCSVYRRN